MPSFSDDVRRELLTILPEKACCLQSELNALTQGFGTILLRGSGRMAVRYRLPDSLTARTVFLILKRRLGIVPQISFHLEQRLRKRRMTDLTVGEADARRLLVMLHILDPKTNGVALHSIPRGTRTRNCCKRAYIRGAFIAGGHIREPQDNYLAEFAVSGPERAELLCDLLRAYMLTPRLRQRDGDYVVAVTRGDEVADLLRLMGASQSLFVLEDIRIRRAAAGTANRQTNWDTANADRLFEAAADQDALIRRWTENHSLSELKPALREIARLRLRYPSASLAELGAKCVPSVGKAAVSLRFRRLRETMDRDIRAEREGENGS